MHLNEDELFESIDETDHDMLLVVFRTHAKCYPDFVDIRYALGLNAYLAGNVQKANSSDMVSNFTSFDPSSIKRRMHVFPTAAAYDPLQPNSIRFVPISLEGTSEQIHQAINECSSVVNQYGPEARTQAFTVISRFEKSIETRLKALVLEEGTRVHDKVWDELVDHDLRSRMFELTNLFGEYLTLHFDSDTASTKQNELEKSIDSMIDSWQTYDLRQKNLKNIISSGYTLANQLLDRASGILHDLLFERHFIEPGYACTVECRVIENDEPIEEVHLPAWTKKTVRERLNRFALNSSLHAKQCERLRTIWLECLQIATFADQYEQQFETVLQPLVDLLLMPKEHRPGSALRKPSSKTGPQFSEFEFSNQTLLDLLTHLKQHWPLIQSWIANMPNDLDTSDEYYATLWMILTDGKIRERLNNSFLPLCDINLSLPVETKRLIDVVLSERIVISNDKDLSNLKRNLDRALLVKTGRGLRETSTPSMLEIHGDLLFHLLRIELLAYQGVLEKRASRTVKAKHQNKRRNSNKGKRTDNSRHPKSENLSSHASQIEKVMELIEFLTQYTKAPQILVEAGIKPESTSIQQIRRQQLMNFNLQELPPIQDTWLDNIKSVDEYPNLRAFLLEYQLPISTTGRRLMHLRKTSSQPDQNGSSRDAFRIAVQLVQEIKTLEASRYEGEVLDRFLNHLAEKLWRWEVSQITEEQLPTLIKEKLLSSSICYRQDVESLLEYVERYDQLIETKVLPASKLRLQSQVIEEQFQELVESML